MAGASALLELKKEYAAPYQCRLTVSDETTLKILMITYEMQDDELAVSRGHLAWNKLKALSSSATSMAEFNTSLEVADGITVLCSAEGELDHIKATLQTVTKRQLEYKVERSGVLPPAQ